MQNNIQNIIERFDRECPLIVGAGSKTLIRELISSSLTELLDSLERAGNNKIYQLITYAKDNWEDQDTVSKAHFAAAQLKEVINIINSHR